MMTNSVLLSLAVFAFVNSITPGPNNVMLTASGSTFGYRRSLPHMLGITSGVALMLLLVGAGLGTVFDAMPMLYTALKYAGAVYLLYLAWRIARAGAIDSGQARGKPFTFIEAAAFQWVNPKAWVMAVGIVAAYMPQENFYWNLALGTLVVSCVNFPSISAWTLFGSAVRRLLHRPQSVQRFNIAMAILLVASLYGVVSV
ncbi:LysE family translocator [Pollutimonas harenae]|uniref:LysE family translocator n=1 Tax=Pollutimonas harenae TaxID=657015 RepID=A0A853H3P1_9BURK|nr:LysE family translocator [Pollutimonas harenae]NYT86499.1 LysE family translocator [Pollutimonas harenae]TEA69757.1 LysE family translocator [Pollutimonas harenae]